MHIKGKQVILLLVLITVFLFAFTLNAQAETEKKLSSGQTVYVSIYSNIFSGPKKVPLELASMLSIRNTDPKHSITILSADYYDSSGKKVERYIKNPVKLNPLASTHYYIKEYDTKGGPGANFIVKWSAKNKVNQPIIEGLMIGLGGKGVAFICPGQVITEH
ncbi:MAG: DUF3124 domain-containing protein [Ignavibacteriaceae bacterium]